MSKLLTPTLAACLAITASIHAATYLLNAPLPMHLVNLGGSSMQVGMLLAVTSAVSMVLRPLVGGWIDRYGVVPVILPGSLALGLTAIALGLAASPGAVIALMMGIGLSSGLITTSSGVLATRASGPERRGEVLSLYYLATSIAIAIAPPAGIALFFLAGIGVNLAIITGLAIVIAAVIAMIPRRDLAPSPGAQPGLRILSRHAAAAGGTMVLATIGGGSIYAFLPLYCLAHGQGRAIGWFFAVYSACMFIGRFALRRASDRLGRHRILIPALLVTTLGLLVLGASPRPSVLMTSAILLGSGAAVFYPTLLALVVDRAPEAERGLAVGTLAGSYDLGVVTGSLLVGFVVERTSHGMGFIVGGLMAALGLATFLVTERRQAGLSVLPRPSPGV